MTKTYNDIEAVSRLLEEKERDLELAAKIGQSLLERNRDVEEKKDILQEELVSTAEKLNQLKHDLVLKDELLKLYIEETEETATSPGFSLQNVNVNNLQQRVSNLEEDNLCLKSQFDQLHSDADSLEEREQKLVCDCLDEFGNVIKERDELSEELAKRDEELLVQKEELTSYLANIVDAQSKIRELSFAKTDLQKQYESSNSSKNQIKSDMKDLKDRYDELCAMLSEAQDELRFLRKKQRPGVARQYISSSPLCVPSDSLASELENSMRGDFEYPPGYSPQDRSKHNWKIFETARAARRATKKNSGRSSRLSTHGAESSGNESVSPSIRNSFYLSDGEHSDGYVGDIDSMCGSMNGTLGVPGIPGSNDLETAVRRLALEDEVGTPVRRRDKSLSMEPNISSPEGMSTPDGSFSTGSGSCQSGNYSRSTSGPNPHYRLPEKLQIIKPLEGSLTLRQWQQLATPNFGGIFDSRPGVQIKGERKLDLEEEMYSLSDFEEDDEVTDSCSRVPGSAPSQSSDISDASVCGVPRLTHGTQNSKPMSGVRRKVMKHRALKGTMTLGLASILNERDLQETAHPRLETDNSYTMADMNVVPSTSHSVLRNDTGRVTVPTSNANNAGKKPPESPAEQFVSLLKTTGASFYDFLSEKMDLLTTDIAPPVNSEPPSSSDQHVCASSSLTSSKSLEIINKDDDDTSKRKSSLPSASSRVDIPSVLSALADSLK